MAKKRALIIGAGISGLSLAWYLEKNQPELDIILIEKSDRIGGWLKTENFKGFHFELGPRTFKASRCVDLLQLVKELGLEKEIIWSDDDAKKRYIWSNGALNALPSNPIQFLRSPLTKGVLKALIHEIKAPVHSEDESVGDFISRRLSPIVSEKLFEPLMLGIYAGDIHALSVEACLPKMKQWEKDYGSIVKGFFANRRKIVKHPGTLFTFRDGIETLARALKEQLQSKIRLNNEMQPADWKADFIFSTLSAKAMHGLISPIDPDLGQLFSLPAQDLTVTHLGYHSPVLKERGFGYLVPSSENEPLLGVVFDSCIFPQQNHSPEQTRLTVMQRGLHRDIDRVLEILKRHLKIMVQPDAVQVHQLPHALPQYQVGHLIRMAAIRNALETKLPQLKWLGMSVNGVSVNDCIRQAREQARLSVKDRMRIIP